MEFTALALLMLEWAVFLTGYPEMETIPPIEFADITYLQSKSCPQTMHCHVIAIWDSGTVVLRKDVDIMDDPYHRGILVHEFVHALQIENDSHSNAANPCERSNQREVEAYGVQNAYYVMSEKMLDHAVNFHPASCTQ